MREQVEDFWSQRSPRERWLISGVLACALLMTAWPVFIQPIFGAFQRQSEKLEQLTAVYASAPDALARYARLQGRRKELEKFYSKVDVSSNPLSYLERLLRDTAKASGSYNVTPREEKQIGGKYLHKSFLVNFQSSSLSDVAAFLKELTTGPQPMLVTQISLDRRAATNLLNVSLEVSGFERTGPSK